jgi:hypothetical protein
MGSLSVENAFFLNLFIELFISFSESPYIDIANGDPSIRNSIFDERGLFGCKHTADSGAIFIAHRFISRPDALDEDDIFWFFSVDLKFVD